jgi:thiamine-phosphate pyrophosphorylase
MRSIDFRLYLITDRYLLPPDSLAKRIEALIQNGIKAVQLREKDLPTREILNLTKEIQTGSAKLFINDRADIAHAVGANGLHIPEHGFPANEARKVVGDSLIGKSAHSIEAAIRAEEEGVDFITFGPIYDTPSKRQFGEPLGLRKLKEVASKISIPVFAIGGINPERAKECLDVGAHGVAVISDLLVANDPQSQVEKYLNVLGSL